MRKYLFALLLFSLIVSCNQNTVRSEYQTISNGNWEKDAVVQFTFSEMDTTQTHHIFINLRNDETFPYSNLFLIAELGFPSGQTVRDTLEYEMALADGKWLGKGYGSIKENKFWYKENIVFPSSGVYTLQLSHAMRKNGTVDGIVDLNGITDVGFEIEKSNQ
ncbi:gliding motility lipoprotein GldH [Spongiimicrobium sp. 3-5]|uniref:gliding motility lipoprotein GldH n=1 Tax=Spongiimicrobium sp. 3-5 TaxID=3332596 RepID=UPI0039804658